ncbi:ribosomal protein S5 domain 2-type protein [Catenaria anguillulae PL171]|uniref:Phosphomevalonate kinase n=1 Tax=Catenaria anguillulae PL171 TaxID=765915 RepID=A0A1Y2HBT1_9FUNG|nr:ribosomal protein S5 domain 2-type protein [Catenaria anguillulae PL171]
MSKTASIVSAPGKALIAGGYLVLDPAYSGLVLATSARFYAIVRPSTSTTALAAEINENALPIIVTSPQFPSDPPRHYLVDLTGIDRPGGASFTFRSSPPAANKFIDNALRTALLLAHLRLGPKRFTSALPQANGIDVIVLADNDFYSQSASLARLGLINLCDLPKFTSPSATIASVNKTGLGSSAALVTGIVAGVSRFFTTAQSAASPATDMDKHGIHAAAQLAHCLAQGKIGSGFDVSSAIFGSHRYQRFDPSVLTSAMDVWTAGKHVGQVLAPLIPGLGVKLMLADVAAGSNTPALVSRVLRWRKEKGDEAERVWREIQDNNDRLVEVLEEMGKLDQDQVEREVKAWWTGEAKNGRVGFLVDRLVEILAQNRVGMRSMGQAADVPIEPVEQTKLLDACIEVSGVLGAGVPGAGGYDAIFILYIDHPTVHANLTRALSGFANVTPLLCEASAEGIKDESETAVELAEFQQYL